MKSTIKKDIAHKTAADLAQLITEKKLALKEFRFGNAGAKSKNVKAGRTLRKDIARIKTAMNAKKA